MRRAKRNQHVCYLQHPEEDVLCQFIDTGLFVLFRRWFRNLLQVNTSHPMTAKYFPSHTTRRHERIKHLTRHYLMIHPFSIFSMYWEFVMFVVLIAAYVIIPAGAFSRATDPSESNVMKMSIESLYLLDVAIKFFVGYYDNKNSKVELNWRKVAKRHLQTYFFFDVLSCMQLYMRLILLTTGMHFNQSYLYWLVLFNRLKVIRLPRLLEALELFRKYMGFSSYLFKAIHTILIFCVIVFWSFSITFFIENYLHQFTTAHTAEEGRTVTQSYYDATLLILMISSARYTLTEISEYANAAFCLFFGFALQLFILAQVLRVWTTYYNTEQTQILKLKQYKEYMIHKKMPPNLQQRICTYLDFKFQARFFNDSAVSRMVSPMMNQEIMMHVTNRYLGKVDFFKYLPQDILQAVIGRLKCQIFMPGEVIVRAGDLGNTMYFVNHGTVAVYSPRGREICHLEDGAHFGEIALLLTETRVATVAAVTVSELYVLKRADLLTAIAPYPEVGQRIFMISEAIIKKAKSSTTNIPISNLL